MSRYKLYLLDADDTLLDFGRAEQYAIEESLREKGVDCGAEDISTYSRINSELWVDYEKGAISQEDLRVERFSRLFDARGYRPCSPISFATTFIEHLSKAAFLLPGALETVQKLAERAKLVMITNGITEVQRSRVTLSGLAPYFVGLCISGELGYPKPDPRMVETAMKMADFHDRTATLVVGDSQSADIACAGLAGVDSCLYNPQGKEVTSAPTYVIGRLEDLLEIG